MYQSFSTGLCLGVELYVIKHEVSGVQVGLALHEMLSSVI